MYWIASDLNFPNYWMNHLSKRLIRNWENLSC